VSVEQRSLDETLLAYAEAWNTPDAVKRRKLLEIGRRTIAPILIRPTRCGARRNLRTTLAAP
jgi:hypothetical protein